MVEKSFEGAGMKGEAASDLAKLKEHKILSVVRLGQRELCTSACVQISRLTQQLTEPTPSNDRPQRAG